MVTKATFAGCAWICANHPAGPFFVLSGSIDTDKQHSQMNLLRGRGKRVIAKVTLPADLLPEQMRVTAQHLFRTRQFHATGSFMSGVANNGAHAANALAALFIACGQDVADVSESHAGIAYAQLTAEGDCYWSITLPALIVATVGGGTGLATQRECLQMLG